MNAPERIWAWPEPDDEVSDAIDDWGWAYGDWDRCEPTDSGGAQYVRADLFAALEAKAQDLQAKLTECCLQCLATDGQAAEALDRADRAEAEHMETLSRLAGNVAKVAEQKALLREAVEALRKVSDLALSQDIGTLYPEDIFGLESCIDDMATAARATLAKIKDAQNG